MKYGARKDPLRKVPLRNIPLGKFHWGKFHYGKFHCGKFRCGKFHLDNSTKENKINNFHCIVSQTILFKLSSSCAISIDITIYTIRWCTRVIFYFKTAFIAPSVWKWQKVYNNYYLNSYFNYYILSYLQVSYKPIK